ncbi:MAG: nicotinamide mononucleotide deamidase-related protein [Infirmifilum sp.]|jgi:molybdenum cofactor synthesis domain-containing protein|uniref:nicotinamide mononucleotide deamidase-related protein n=2 Tax=Thermofilaceae TaxID=114378 RepID=UPI003C71944E
MMEETADSVTNKLEAEHPPMQFNKAMILSIGNELLIGKVLNTNAHWLSGELTKMGFIVDSIVIVKDDVSEIASAFLSAIERKVQLVISTGGLGPTFDDKTVEGLARAFSLPLVLNAEALALVREKYSSRGLPLTPERIKMAYLPLGSKPLDNPAGTAPGVYLKYRGVHFFVLPGPPREVEAVFKTSVQPIIEREFQRIDFYEALLTIKGIPESEFAPFVKDAAERYKSVYVKSHPKGVELGSPVLEIHLTTFGIENMSQLRSCFEYILMSAKKLGGEIIVLKEPGVKL